MQSLRPEGVEAEGCLIGTLEKTGVLCTKYFFVRNAGHKTKLRRSPKKYRPAHGNNTACGTWQPTMRGEKTSVAEPESQEQCRNRHKRKISYCTKKQKKTALNKTKTRTNGIKIVLVLRDRNQNKKTIERSDDVDEKPWQTPSAPLGVGLHFVGSP